MWAMGEASWYVAVWMVIVEVDMISVGVREGGRIWEESLEGFCDVEFGFGIYLGN
jgi:hypothetical protein